MSGDFTESGLTFTFPDKWLHCKKYDELPFYKNSNSQGAGLKGVDFIALSSRGIVLMEVKRIMADDENSTMRFSQHGDSERVQQIKEHLVEKLTQDEFDNLYNKKIKFIQRPYVADEIAEKVKGTLLGILAASRNSDNDLQEYYQWLDKKIYVIFFLERTADLNDDKQKLNNIKTDIERKLKFLGDIEAMVENSLTAERLGIHVSK